MAKKSKSSRSKPKRSSNSIGRKSKKLSTGKSRAASSRVPKGFKSTAISREPTRSKRIDLSAKTQPVDDYLHDEFSDVDFKSEQEEAYRDLVRKILNHIKRKFGYVGKDRFFYNTKKDLSKLAAKVRVWVRVHDDDKGTSVLDLQLKRKSIVKRDDWAQLLKKSHKGYTSIHRIITQNLLPAINNKRGDEWKFISVVGWAADDSGQNRDTGERMARNKTSRKRRK